MSKLFNVAIVGVTGAVGQEMLRVLEERNFPVGELRLLDSERSVGKTENFKGEEIDIQVLTKNSFNEIDIALFSAGVERSLEFCPHAITAGAVCVDNSDAWRMDPEVPLVVPEVNSDDVSQYLNKKVIASPGCSTTQMVLPLKALQNVSRIKRIVVSTYQAVSGSGQSAVDELRVQSGELLNGRPAHNKIYPHQIAFNCLPHIDSFVDNGYTEEEMRMVHETRKILGDPEIRISSTAVRVPVFYGHSESLNVETEEKISAAQAKELFDVFPGLQVIDGPDSSLYPMPVDAAGQDEILVGRIREDLSLDKGLNFWVAADNLRKGAATNAIQISELLVAKYL